MRHFLYITILSVLSLSFVTCPPDVETDDCCFLTGYYLPQAVLLDIKAVNEMENPVDIKIRHKYFYLFDSEKKDYTSDWSSSYNIKKGETASIGIEQAKRWDENSSWYDEGFVLLSEDSDYHKARYLLWFYSSFEINVVTDDTTTFNIPGYTYNSDFMDYLKRKSYGLRIAGGSCTLELNGHKEKLNSEYCLCGGCPCGCPNPQEKSKEKQSGFSLPMNLTIKADGTYKLEFGEIQAN